LIPLSLENFKKPIVQGGLFGFENL